ncbi:hypothetical protein PHYSODRAFT_320183 [Phytophthora sojae]|uniref:DDE-1 domain-containing protein n=1 Tax=Phytophthora sojae (strain P6497) TaxID=1094619 RepID=G5AH68_PHYSP|nr:hypothetical protein PHYSODRAFT_320183 [Phytophthora sojae]EGZ05047.1 hypothetical protein PHYSODRAFT_320183 [Phytophthora sojae]|eukprot:XP_009539419.1 hypothetical protein PHYSODRAFT_320183 [Phytophthora sojae]
MDQTSVCVDMNPHSTIEFVGARTVDVIQCRKLRPMIVFAATPGAIVQEELKEDEHYDWDRGYYTVQARAYCDRKVMKEWIDKVWTPDIRGPSVLALDSLMTHKMEFIRTQLRMVYVPPGVKGLAQPMDIAVMKPFKDRLRDLYTKFVIENGTFTDGAQKRRHITASVLQAWDEVDTESICNGFVNAGLIATGDERGFFATPTPTSEGEVGKT